MVLLIGNYALERQQSMLRFATMMRDGLIAAGIDVELIQPQPFLGKFELLGPFVAKWLGYIDKFLLFPRRLRAKLRQGVSVAHICDHSNAMYSRTVSPTPVVVTCHDLLAVRGGLGEGTDCPASMTGKLLQRWILSGLKHATVVACVSTATYQDGLRLIPPDPARARLKLIPLGLSYTYHPLPQDELTKRLSDIVELEPQKPFVLHVGSNLRRKNREGVMRVFARCKDRWPGQLVFAGDKISAPLDSLGRSLGISDRIVQVAGPGNELLEALYNGATAFLFPSRFEGFGWPIIEAQACGCPVLCSSTGPMIEVAGTGALFHEPEDEEGFAADLLRLLDADFRAVWRARSLENAKRFNTERMISEYIALYRSLGAC